MVSISWSSPLDEDFGHLWLVEMFVLGQLDRRLVTRDSLISRSPLDLAVEPHAWGYRPGRIGPRRSRYGDL